MRPVLFTIFGRKIYSYLILLYLGLVTGVFAAIPAARSADISPDRFVIATLILIVPALAGARLLYVLMHWHFYWKNPHLIWRNRRNGAALYGGLILVVLASIPVLRLVALPFWPYWDAGIVTLLVGMVFTRIGCLLNGCCSGRPSASWIALRLPNSHGAWCRRLPMQLVESCCALTLVIGATIARSHTPFPGAIFLSAVALYGAARFVFQGLREDPTGGRYLLVGRATSLSLVAAALAMIMILRPR
jgi:phosphatidylglycerol---prolipoprotein diacylglyceryl transferase